MTKTAVIMKIDGVYIGGTETLIKQLANIYPMSSRETSFKVSIADTLTEAIREIAKSKLSAAEIRELGLDTYPAEDSQLDSLVAHARKVTGV